MDGMTVTDYSNVVTDGASRLHGAARRRDRDDARQKGLPDRALHRRDQGGRNGHHRRRRPGDAVPAGPGFYPNAIHYYPADDSYTLSDRNLASVRQVQA